MVGTVKWKQTLLALDARVLAAVLGVAAGALLACWRPALAMGPLAPFSPPSMDAIGGASQQGLKGVRLKRHVGAVIDGQWVALGGTVRGAKLEAVGAKEATLRHPDGQAEVLQLYADAMPTAPTNQQASKSASAPGPSHSLSAAR